MNYTSEGATSIICITGPSLVTEKIKGTGGRE